MGIDALVNHGGAPAIDTAAQTIHNDRYWKGFFPAGHVLNAMSSAIFTGFRKEFHKEANGTYSGITSDTDGRIHARNSLEEIEIAHDAKGTLEPGRYILLRYLDPPWQGFYDIFKMVNNDLLIGRVYLGEFPNGSRVFTFPMTRAYRFDQMTVDDHKALFAAGPPPTAPQLDGVWRMDTLSNANHLGGIAYLQFSNKPDGRFEARYELMGLMEGLVTPAFLKDHFQLNDFTPFHDEIRRVTDDFLVGKYMAPLPPALAALVGNQSLGLFHAEDAGQFGFYYTLTRQTEKELPRNTLLRPFLDVQLPDGVGMTFDEKMEGWYFSGMPEPPAGHAGDLTIGAHIPATGDPSGAVACVFDGRMTIRDVNEFVDGYEHEASIKGTMTFGSFEGAGPATFAIDESNSRFNYLRVNAETGEAEMRYHIEFSAPDGRRFLFDGTKYMQKDSGVGAPDIAELLQDYTTLYCRVHEQTAAGLRSIGMAYLKFRTFENLAAVGSMAAFLTSFQVTGTGDPVMQFQARMRFIAFTGQFVMREYDPLAPGTPPMASEVRADVMRGAADPQLFSSRSTTELQSILRDSPTLPLETLANSGKVRVDFDKQRIYRDSFWQGSFAKDTLVGWEERLRTARLGTGAESAGAGFAGGSFWKRFDAPQQGVLKGYVVNYELVEVPGLPEVRAVSYPDDRRRYFKKGDSVLLLTYTNGLYQIVYDTIKVIDAENAIGVMHLGVFPDGIEFATFVMTRQSYPFQNMSVPDAEALFQDSRAAAPSADTLAGDWNGRLISLLTPDTTLMNQERPIPFQASFQSAGGKTSGQGKTAGVDFTLIPDATSVRMLGTNTLVGKATGVAPALGDTIYFVLKR